MTPALDLLVDAFAVHRLTRLVTEDVITEPVRDRIIEGAYQQASRPLPQPEWPGQSLTERAAADNDAPKLASLIVCRWCSGFYVAAAAVSASMFAPRAWRPVARALALSSAAALLANLED